MEFIRRALLMHAIKISSSGNYTVCWISYLTFMFYVRFGREKSRLIRNVRVTSIRESDVTQRLNPKLHRNTKNKAEGHI